MRTPYPPERLEVELQSRLGPSLSAKGYRVVGNGVAGVTWRRAATQKFVWGLILLVLLAVSGIASLDVSSIIFGCGAAGGAVVLFILRRPATVDASFQRLSDGGTEIQVSGGPDAAATAELLRTVVPTLPMTPTPPSAPERPERLWGPA